MDRFIKSNKVTITIIFFLAVVLLCVFLANNYFKEKNEIVKEKMQQDMLESDQKTKDDQRKFVADQKNNCLNIYKQESAKFNNTNSWRYDSSENLCYIEYKMDPKKTLQQCDVQYQGKDGKVVSFFTSDWLLCREGLFQKSF